MRRLLEWTMVLALCCAMPAMAGEEPSDTRLEEAQKAFAEATALQEKGQYVDAIAKGEHALALREAVLGGSHLEVAACLKLLSSLQEQQGNVTQAVLPLQRALSIQEAILGKNHLELASTLADVAAIYIEQGLSGQAEPLLQRALAIQEGAFGKDHLEVAQTLMSLAHLYEVQRLYDRAEQLYQRAIAIREATLGKDHPRVANILNSLANVYLQQRLYDRAEPLYLRAMAILEQAFGKNSPDVASPYHNLAILYDEQGLYSRARALYQHALAILEQSLDKNDPRISPTLGRLANLYTKEGLYDRAEPLYLRALAIDEASFGKDDHRRVVFSLNNLARFRLAQRRLEEALPLLERILALSEQRLRLESLTFSEDRLTRLLQFLSSHEELLYSLLRAHPDNPRVQRLALTAALLRKGRSAEETSHTSRTIFRSLDAQDHDTFERLRSLRARFASLSLQGPGAQPPAEHQKRLKELADQGDALEADLARRSAALRTLSALPPPAQIIEHVAAAIPKDGALVEFVAYADQPIFPKPGPLGARSSGQLRYLALVLLPDARIRALDLGPAAPIDRAASQLHDALATSAAGSQGSARVLYRWAFQPLLPLLGGARRLFLSPDGQLSLIPFAALHDGRRFLIDSFDFSYLTSGKDLLPRPQDIAPAGSVVVLADPAFGAFSSTPSRPQETAPEWAQRSASLERFFSAPRPEGTDHAWAPLPGTRQEALAIQRLLPQAQLFLGPEATKQRLLQLPTPGVLHIATHGFFLEDSSTPADARAVGYFGALGNSVAAQPPPDPLLRSGLVLTGALAQTSNTPNAASHRAEVYLVTALELAGLNLWGTQLVVLSACDTGRGDIKLGQGVYGLRRALVVAGAETVVMSLWKVNDDSTRQLMEDYYRYLLAGRGRAAALREAMRALRQARPHPHFWAPFIALGSDSPLRSLTPAPQPQP